MTSIEWFYNEIKHIIPNDFLHKYEQAKEMHKQEIIDAVNAIDEYPALRNERITFGEQYYQETFVSKGSDEVELPKQDVDKLGYQDVPKLGYDTDLPTTTSDLIDSAIWSLPFDERIKCWDLIEKLIEEEKETLYTEEQVREAIRMSRVTNTTNVIGGGVKLHTYSDNEIIQSLKQPKKD